MKVYCVMKQVSYFVELDSIFMHEERALQEIDRLNKEAHKNSETIYFIRERVVIGA